MTLLEQAKLGFGRGLAILRFPKWLPFFELLDSGIRPLDMISAYNFVRFRTIILNGSVLVGLALLDELLFLKERCGRGLFLLVICAVDNRVQLVPQRQ